MPTHAERQPEPAHDEAQGEPNYLRIRRSLLEIVHRRRHEGPGTFLFTEQEIAARFEVHRLTARQAIQGLVAEGLVYQIRGRGTLLAAPKVAEPLDRISNFMEDWPMQGRDASTEVLRFQTGVTEDLPDRFAGQLKAPVLYFERLRRIGGVPVALDRRWVTRAAAGLFTVDRLKRLPIQSILAVEGLRPLGTELEIEAISAENAIAGSLSTTVGSPLLLRTVSVVDQDRSLLLGGFSYQRGDLFKYKIFLKN